MRTSKESWGPLSSCYQLVASSIVLDVLIIHSDRGVRDKRSHFTIQALCSIFPSRLLAAFSFFAECLFFIYFWNAACLLRVSPLSSCGPKQPPRCDSTWCCEAGCFGLKRQRLSPTVIWWLPSSLGICDGRVARYDVTMAQRETHCADLLLRAVLTDTASLI